MEFEVPKRHLLSPTLSTMLVQWALWWERQRGAMVEKKARAHGKESLL